MSDERRTRRSVHDGKRTPHRVREAFCKSTSDAADSVPRPIISSSPMTDADRLPLCSLLLSLQGCITSLDFTSRGDSMVYSTDEPDESLHLYNVSSAQPKKSVFCKKSGCEIVRFTHHTNCVIVASKNKGWDGQSTQSRRRTRPRWRPNVQRQRQAASTIHPIHSRRVCELCIISSRQTPFAIFHFMTTSISAILRDTATGL